MIYAINKVTKEHRIADLTEEWDCNWVFQPTLDSRGFITWPGGDCPMMRDEDCEVICRSTPRQIRGRMAAGSWSWKHSNSGNDIIAYRPVHLNEQNWDGKEWPPKEGDRVRARLAGSDGFELGTVKAVGTNSRVAVKLDGGHLATYSENQNGDWIKPIQSVMNQEIEAMLTLGAGRSRKQWAEALYKAGYRKP